MRRYLPALIAALVAAPALAQPQQPGLIQPRLNSLAPFAARAGTSVEAICIGQELDDPQGLLFAHPGIKAEYVPPPKPPEPKPDPKQPAPKKDPPKPPAGPPKFKITVDANVPVGCHDVRIVCKSGLSNPRAFVVSDTPEAIEKEPNNDVKDAQRVELNAGVGGAITGGTDVDYFVFAAKAGQRVLVYCQASSVDSKLKPSLELFAGDKRLAVNRNYANKDALLDVTIPADGDYLVRLSEFTYLAGSADHFYRVTFSTGPRVEAVFPPMIEPGKPAQVTVYGRNLPGGQPDPAAVIDGRPLEKLTVTISPPPGDTAADPRLAFTGRISPESLALDGFEYRIKGPTGTSNPFLITYAKAKVVAEAEGPNDKSEGAQELPVPCEAAGRIDRRFDRDWFAFNAKKGETFSVELLADRIGNPTDLYFAIKSPDGKQDVGEFDDSRDAPNLLHQQQLYTGSSDPAVAKFVAPADGRFLIAVASRESATQFGPRHYYRLRVTPEQPDFRLIVMPASDNRPDAAVLRQDGAQNYDVFLWRLDGFNGPVTLTAEGLPPGVTCPPQTIPPGAKQGTLVLVAAADAKDFNGPIRVKGTAKIGGQDRVREARPVTITWPVQPQQNIPAIARLDESLALAVRAEKPPFKLAAELPPTVIKQGEKVTVQLKLARNWPDAKVPLTVQSFQPPNPNLTLNNNQPLTIAPDKADGSVVLEARSGLAPGTYTVALRCQMQFPIARNPANPSQKTPAVVVLPSTPVTVTVLPASVATLALTLPNPNLKAGATTELMVRVNRQHDYAGEFKLKLVLPPGAAGLAADEVTIPAGQNEAKVVLKAPADAKPANLSNVVLQATAVVNGNVTLTHEQKFNVNIVK